MRESSRSLGHTERAQAAATGNIRISNVEFESDDGRVPIHIAPDVTGVTIEDSKSSADSRDFADNNRVAGNVFLPAVSRAIKNNGRDNQIEK